MKGKKLIASIIMVTVVLTSCLIPKNSVQLAERQMIVKDFNGSVEVKGENDSEWEKVGIGFSIEPGSSIRTSSDGDLLLETNDGFAVAMGMSTIVDVEDLGLTFSDPTIILYLKEGGLIMFSKGESQYKGEFSVKTEDITFTMGISESARNIKVLAAPARFGTQRGVSTVTLVKGQKPEDVATKVGVFLGNGTVSYTDDSKKVLDDLDAGLVCDAANQSIEVYSMSLVEEARKMGIKDLTKYSVGFLFTPEPSNTPTKTVTITPILADTWTPFPTFEISTITPTPNPLPTHQIGGTPSIGEDGLTDEERANSGLHAFSGYGYSVGECVFTGTEAEKLGIIEFTRDNVTLKPREGEGSMTYQKIEPNIYRIIKNGFSVTLTFFIDGWDMTVIKDGQPCSYQTFLLQ